MPGVDDDLQHCRRELLRLTIENAALRYAAMTFGDLAERLNSIVIHHRRFGLLRPHSQPMADDSATMPPENP